QRHVHVVLVPTRRGGGSGGGQMTLLRQIWQDLRSKRLWPVAAVLLVAIVAVPVVLSGSSSAPTVAPPRAPAPVANGLPAVSDTALPASSAPTGSARNPFGPAG